MYLVSFLLGLGGSMHCIGMCGPLVLAASGQTLVNSSRTFNFIIYHVGRILIYACFGFIMGLFGLGIHISGLQKYFSILLGIFIIILALYPGTLSRIFRNQVITGSFWKKIKQWFFSMQSNNKPINRFMLGAMNGFLPCGLVYIALANSMLANNPGEGFLYMMVFGFGTTPSLILLPMMIRIFKIKQYRFQRLVPYLLFGIGMLLVVRGVQFQYPFINEVNDFISTCIGI